MNERNRLPQVLAFLGPYRARLAGLLALTLLLSVLSMLPPLVTRAIIDRVITARERSVFSTLAVLMLALPLVNAACAYLQTLGMAYVGQRFVADLRDALYGHLLRLSMRFFGKRSVGMLVNRLMGDSGTVQSMLTAQTLGIVSDLVCSAFAITAAFALNWRLAFLIVVLLTIFIINFRLSAAGIRHANRSYQRSLDRLSAGVTNRLSASLAVKSFGTEAREHGVFRGQSDESLDLVRGLQDANIRFSMNTNLLTDGGRALIYFLGCAMVLMDQVSYGDVVAFTSYSMQLLSPALRLSMIARQLQDVKVAGERLFDVFDETPEIHDASPCVSLSRLRGQVDFEHVSFYYEKGKPVIRDFDLHVQPGQTLAIIGPTGCGKTTILSLLLRFFDVTDGALKLDGTDIRHVALADLRRQFGIVLQEPLLFTASIGDNIRYARPGATRQAIEEAARVAEIHDFIETLPQGYDTIVGVEGVQLSVGQKQRISIARAVAADPAILIMDEATSSLDSESERAIQVAMGRVLSHRTAFIVAHRLSTIRNADRIVVMKEGRILELGRHDELMRANRAYASLYRKHMGKKTIVEESP
jgi:subfamily B ATP-binding cassette protein MsbA